MQTDNAHFELDYLVRALSHDMSANFMLLENSFSQLKRSLVCQKSGVLHDDVHRRIDHVDACMRESKRFLEDLVRLAKTGSVEMEAGRVELSSVVEDVIFEQRDLLDRHRVELSIQQPLSVFWCNQARLKQIVTNLVRNAVLHGCDPQSPQISVTATSSKELSLDGMAAFRIHDNGPGMDPRYRRDIFLPGRRLGASGAEGSGMGLAIAKKICDHYRGSIYVDPDCRSGTAFVVVLPEAAIRRQDEQPVPDGRKWKLELDRRHRQTAGQLHGTRASKRHLSS